MMYQYMHEIKKWLARIKTLTHS